MAEVYTGGDRSQQALLQSILDRLHELEKPGAGDVQRVTVKVVEAKNEAVAASQAAGVADAKAETVKTDLAVVTDTTIPAISDAVVAVDTKADAADAKAQEALDRPAGGTEITFASRAPDSTDVAENGTVWYHRDGTNLVGQYLRENDAWVQQAIDSGLIADVLVGKRIEGGEIVGGTIDGQITVNSGGSIVARQPNLQSPTRIGIQRTAGVWVSYLDRNGLSFFRDDGIGSTIAGGITSMQSSSTTWLGITSGSRGFYVGADGPRAGFGVDISAASADIASIFGASVELTGSITYGANLLSPRGLEILPGYFQVNNLRSNNASTYTQTINNATWTAMNIPTAALASHVTTYNTMGIGISGNALYVPRTGLYEFDVNAVFGNATGGTARSIAFSVNGSAAYVWESANRQPSYVNAVLLQRAFAKLALNANDYVQVMFRQDSGAALGLCRIENYGVKFIGSS